LEENNEEDAAERIYLKINEDLISIAKPRTLSQISSNDDLYYQFI